MTGFVWRIAAWFALFLVVLVASACEARSQPAAGASAAPATPIASPVRRCLNLGNALEAPREGQWGYRVRAEDLTRIREAGFDAVRLPVKWSAHAADRPPYAIHKRFFERIDEVLAQALDADLTVVLNVHHYGELMSDPRAHEPRLEAFWDQIAARYASWSDRLIFEFVNEPHGDMTNARVDALNRRLIDRVRLDNPDRWLVVTGSGWSNLEPLTKTKPPRGARIMTTFHHYGPFEFTHQGAHWTWQDLPVGVEWGSAQERQEVRDVMAEAAAFRDRTGLPILLGEFGAYGIIPLDQRADYTGAMREAAEAEGIGWCHWDFASGFPVYDMDSETWLQPMLDALIPPLERPDREPVPAFERGRETIR